MSHVLVVDDEPSICWGFEQLLSDQGHAVTTAATAEEACLLARRTPFDLVVLDVRLPGQDGLTTLPQLREILGPAVPFVVITAFGNLETAVQAVRAGAFDYVTKPFDLDQVATVLQRALQRKLPDETGAEIVPAPDRSGCLLGQSAAMQRVFKDIALVAPSSAPVLVTGESGTGKEEVALAIHRFSARHRHPFVPVFLGALSPGLVESELFGHARGAFTGAAGAREGLLALAHGGTAFLDEIGDVPLPVQVKLLRAIERKQITPVGEAVPKSVDFRVIAATHRPLQRMVERGEFREDLLYRLGVYHIEVPPLRERRDDIPLLARFFLQTIQSSENAQNDFSDAALAELSERPWRGNVRELRNAVERAAIVARGELIEPCHLPPLTVTVASVPADSPSERIVADVKQWTDLQLTGIEINPTTALDLYDRFLNLVEPPLLQTTLTHTNQQRGLAAQLLGIHRSTLRQKLTQHGQGAGEE